MSIKTSYTFFASVCVSALEVGQEHQGLAFQGSARLWLVIEQS
jgi:hypothetical protein